MHKNCPHIFILLFFFFFAITQGKDTKEAAKVNRGVELLERARGLAESNTEEAEIYSMQALDLGIEEQDELIINRAYYQLVVINFNYGQNEKAIEYAELAEAGLKKQIICHI